PDPGIGTRGRYRPAGRTVEAKNAVRKTVGAGRRLLRTPASTTTPNRGLVMAVAKKKKTTIKDQKTTETIERARETGRLTYDELDELLPQDATPEEIDDVMV